MEWIPSALKGAKAAYDSRKMGGELWNSLMVKLKGQEIDCRIYGFTRCRENAAI